MYGGKFAFQNRLGRALFLEGNLPFFFVLLCNWEQFPSTSPRGKRDLYLEGRFTEGFLRYEFGGFIFLGAYTWKSLFLDFYGTSYRVPRCLKFVWKMENSTASDNIEQWDESSSPLFPTESRR